MLVLCGLLAGLPLHCGGNYIHNTSKMNKTITENSVISLMQRNYGNETIAQRCEKLQEEVSELNEAFMNNHTTEQIKGEIADVYSVIIDIADRYNLHLYDVSRMTIKKHKERGKG